MAEATIREMADEHAAGGRAAGTEAIRRRSFLLGARAALEMAAAKVKSDADEIMQNYVMTGPAGIIVGCIASIRTLTPKD